MQLQVTAPMLLHEPVKVTDCPFYALPRYRNTKSYKVSVKTGLVCEHGQEFGGIEENHKGNTGLSD